MRTLMSAMIKDLPEGDLGPLSPEHFVQLRQSNRRSRKLRATARFASISGWTTLVAGVATLPFALGNGVLFALAIALCGIGYHELALRGSLRRLDSSALGMLAFNQGVLACVIIAYAVWKLMHADGAPIGLPSAFADPAIANEPALANLNQSVESLQRTVLYAVYGGLIAATALVQGFAISYYLGRRRHLRRFLSETPAWVLTLHRGGIFA